MAWNQSQFDEAVRRKYDVLGQNADSDTTRANATAQDVAQRPGMQAAADAAAMDRAQLASQTQMGVAGINESGANTRTGMTTQAQRDIAARQDQGALARTQLQTGTQRDIAGQSLGFDREKLAQQGQQFGQTLALDTGKAQETAIQSRAQLATPEYGTPTFNPKTSVMESGVKRPPITGLAPSPLSTLAGGSALAAETDDDLKKRRAAAMAAIGQ